MAPFKDEINSRVVALWGERIGGSATWVQATSLPLVNLELKARVAHVAQGIWEVLGPDLLPALERLKAAAVLGNKLKLQVNAGHGINQQNLPELLTVPHLAELNIGHTLIARSVRLGLTEAVKEMRAAMEGYAL